MLTRILVLALLIPSLALAQSVKYEKYKLDNGLTVILHEDHKLPVVSVNLWYRVGAQNEPKGRSGFAHLYEHLMFMGTERVPGSDFDNLMEAGGGSNNASTSLDRTNYFSSGPSSLLPTLLWLEADRIEDLGRAMTKEKLDRQRDVVRNEIRQNVENTPYGRLEEDVNRYMYPEGHPYHWNVYGLHEDLEAATAHDVKDFFATFYTPSNCSLVVAGDFDSAKIKPLIQSLFASIPAGAKPPQPTAEQFPIPQLKHATTITMLDKVELPRIRYAYHSPPHFAEGDADLDLAAAVLTQGKSSRLYKRLVLDEKLAVDVSASQDSAVLGSQFFVDIVCPPEADLARVQAIADEEIARLAQSGPTSEELEQRKATIELGALSRLESIDAIADRLNEYEYAFGEPDSFKRDLDRYRNATPDSVKRWTAHTLRPDARVIIRCLPEEPAREPGKSPRDQRPQDLSPGQFTPPAAESFTLTSGLPVLFWNQPAVPLVSVELVIPGAATAAAPEQAGLAYLTARMLGEGAGDLDAVKFADTMQSLGAVFGASADRQTFDVELTVLKRNFDKALTLMADAVRRPRLTETDFERVKRLHLEQLEQDLSDPAVFSQRVFARQLFGPDHPYAAPPEGSVATVTSLSLADIKQLYAKALIPRGATLLVSGDLTRDEARTALEKAFGDWSPASAAPTAPLTIPPIPSTDALRVFLIDRPDAVQTVIRFATPAPAAADPARAKLRVLNTLFGGSFTSRLNHNIREEHGYAYGAGSRFVLLPGTGYFVASASVKSDVTGPALGEFLKEFSRLRGGPIGATFVAAPRGDISDEELTKAVQTVRTETIQSFEGHAGPLQAASECLASGLTYDTVAADLASLSSINAAELNLASRDATPLERGLLLLIGDKAQILEQIKDLGLPTPIELTPEGEPVH
jgi:predicted Zn-dependent peptidase